MKPVEYDEYTFKEIPLSKNIGGVAVFQTVINGETRLQTRYVPHEHMSAVVEFLRIYTTAEGLCIIPNGTWENFYVNLNNPIKRKIFNIVKEILNERF